MRIRAVGTVMRIGPNIQLDRALRQHGASFAPRHGPVSLPGEVVGLAGLGAVDEGADLVARWGDLMTRSNAKAHPPPTRDQSIDQETATSMLLIDFEQAFVVHNAYRDSERDLLRLSLRILAFPPVIAGALLSAKLISSPEQVSVVLRLPLIWLALVEPAPLSLSHRPCR